MWDEKVMERVEEFVGGFMVRRHFRFVVGDGSKIRFWHDTRCGDKALKVAFPAFYWVAREQEASMADIKALVVICNGMLVFSKQLRIGRLELSQNFLASCII